MKQNVLIVDDEETIRNLLKSRLSRDGYEVTTAANADEAERAFTQTREFSVVVTDLKMPGKDGLTFMSWCRTKHPLTRVIMITGHGDKDVAVKALKQGAADYLEKPFDMDELSHSVRRCSREHALERENADLVSRLEARVERVDGGVRL